MSILNVWHEPHRVTIGVDTRASGLGVSSTAAANKALYLPSHRSAIAGRGAVLFFALVSSSLLTDTSGCVEGLREVVLDKLREGQKAYRELVNATGKEVSWSGIDGQEFMLSGWSELRGCFLSTFYTLRDGGPIEVVHLGEGGCSDYYCSSWPEEMGELPDCQTTAEKLASMRLQVSCDKKGICGGDLWLLDLTPAGAAFTVEPC